MGSLLVGVNRAFSYTKPEQDEHTSHAKHFENLFNIAHTDSLVPATQALAPIISNITNKCGSE